MQQRSRPAESRAGAGAPRAHPLVHSLLTGTARPLPLSLLRGRSRVVLGFLASALQAGAAALACLGTLRPASGHSLCERTSLSFRGREREGHACCACSLPQVGYRGRVWSEGSTSVGSAALRSRGPVLWVCSAAPAPPRLCASDCMCGDPSPVRWGAPWASAHRAWHLAVAVGPQASAPGALGTRPYGICVPCSPSVGEKDQEGQLTCGPVETRRFPGRPRSRGRSWGRAGSRWPRARWHTHISCSVPAVSGCVHLLAVITS